MEKNKKNVLLINPSKGFVAPYYHPHLGLGHLATILKKNGHNVLVLDYNGYGKTPSINSMCKRFKPDVVLITSFTPSYSATDKLIKGMQKYKIPIIVGGPHVSCNISEMMNAKGIDYLFVGEAESKINDLVTYARKNRKPKVVYGELQDVLTLDFPDFTTFYGYEHIDSYPLLTSRGCPYNCSFCAVKIVSSQKWRPRTVESCIEELEIMKNTLPGVKRIVVNDDNFTLDLKRAKKFLREYIKRGFKYTFEISNIRADRMDLEFIDLLKKLGCDMLGVAVEAADPQVFLDIDKKEDFNKIRQATKIIKKKGLRLSVCMIVGLPYETLEKVKKSIKFVKEIEADIVYWNMFTPLKGTRAYEWFEKNGTIIKNREQCFNPLPDQLMVDEPVVETKEFTFEERKKAYLMALLETGTFSFTNPKPILNSIKYIIKYNLYMSFIRGLFYGFKIRSKYVLNKFFKKFTAK